MIYVIFFINLKYNFLNLCSIYQIVINYIYYCYYFSENEILKKKIFFIWRNLN